VCACIKTINDVHPTLLDLSFKRDLLLLNELSFLCVCVYKKTLPHLRLE